MKQLNISPKIKPSFFLSKISDFKNRFKSPNECGPDKEKDSSSIQIQEIYDMYQKRLYSANAIDFDDIIFYTVKIEVVNLIISAFIRVHQTKSRAAHIIGTA